MRMMRKSSIVPICLFVLFSSAGLHLAQGPKDDDFDHAISKEMRRHKIPSLAACIIRDDAIVWQRAYGYADLGTKKPASMDTVYLIASLSKLVAGVAAMQLHEKGTLAIDADINEYLPFRVRHPAHPEARITVRMLLTHRSGLAWPTGQDYPEFYKIYPGDSAPPLGSWLRDTLIPGGSGYDPRIWKNWAPGEKQEYSNTGAALLGYVLEKASGVDYADYCRKRIFEPLGMSNTSFRLRSIDAAKLAQPYDEDLTPVVHYGVPFYPSTTLRTSVPEFARFLIAMMNGGQFRRTRILSKDSVEESSGCRIPDLCRASFLVEI
jgi:CubicO group peptidase (beta-lactamase class C family)